MEETGRVKKKYTSNFSLVSLLFFFFEHVNKKTSFTPHGVRPSLHWLLPPLSLACISSSTLQPVFLHHFILPLFDGLSANGGTELLPVPSNSEKNEMRKLLRELIITVQGKSILVTLR